MAIILFSMNGCGFCQKAKQLLKKLIDSGAIQVMDAKDAPKGVRGFPFFLNTENNMQHTGHPGTVENLMNKLGVGKGKSPSPKPTPIPPNRFGCKNNDDCPKGSLCDISKNPPQCVKIPGPVKPTKPISCDPNIGCPKGMVCDLTNNICVPVPAGQEGGFCIDGYGEPKCNDGLFCANGICVKDLPGKVHPKLTPGDIAGIVIGSIAGVILLVLLGMMIFKKGKKGRKSRK